MEGISEDKILRLLADFKLEFFRELETSLARKADIVTVQDHEVRLRIIEKQLSSADGAGKRLQSFGKLAAVIGGWVVALGVAAFDLISRGHP